jgi:hypothetical protein
MTHHSPFYWSWRNWCARVFNNSNEFLGQLSISQYIAFPWNYSAHSVPST